jgi:hypothetical protein
MLWADDGIDGDFVECIEELRDACHGRRFPPPDFP